MDGPAAVEIVKVGDLDVQVRVSERRRHVRLTVERDAAVTAVVPPGVDRAELVRIVKSRRRWLYGKLAERQALGERRPEREYVSGEGFPYLGRSHRLLIVDGAPSPVRLVRGRLELRRDALDDPAGVLIGWYSRRGRAWLPARLHPWAERMRAPRAELRVLPLGYRWGSCSLKGRLNIHWATMQLPPDLIDYVLAHEVAHLHEHDHGERFWRRLERAMPDYTARRTRLKRLGPDLWLP
ncbi:SprT family zinc-dependent metalloprotease [Actinomadura luteofluorescens]|uniref:M48 family metallopeptidase n=1 Tax=Actinomadura luteofluorescens TaxID=46163 RepID=UPI0030CE5EA8